MAWGSIGLRAWKESIVFGGCSCRSLREVFANSKNQGLQYKPQIVGLLLQVDPSSWNQS